MADPDRLQAWFANEVRRAEGDVRQGLVTQLSVRVRRGPLRRRTFAGGVLASTGIVVLVVAAVVGGLLGGTAVVSPGASGSGPGPSQGIIFGPNGIPTSIDGQPVLTPGKAYSQAAAATDATAFLVGGWLDGAKAACPPAIAPFVSHNPWPTILIDTGLCGVAPALLPEPPGLGLSPADYGTSAVSPIFLPDGPSEPSTSGPVVLRVHAHDPQATSCEPSVVSECERAVVVDAVVWQNDESTSPTISPSPSGAGNLSADGIPQTFDGQPVLRGTAAADFAAAATDDTSFVVGGWLASIIAACALQLHQPPLIDRELTDSCARRYLSETPTLAGPGDLLIRRLIPGPIVPSEGPAVLRVHTHDPQAASCSPADIEACEHAVVVEAVLWDGPIMGSDGLPAWIDGQQPLSVAQAAARLTSSTDSAPFLVRGWFDLFPLPCPYVPAPSGGAGLRPYSCPPIFIGPAPIPRTQHGATADDISLVLPSGVDPPANGPVVLEIHGHDPGAARCAPNLRSACAAAVVVDKVVWVGP